LPKFPFLGSDHTTRPDFIQSRSISQIAQFPLKISRSLVVKRAGFPSESRHKSETRIDDCLRESTPPVTFAHSSSTLRDPTGVRHCRLCGAINSRLARITPHKSLPVFFKIPTPLIQCPKLHNLINVNGANLLGAHSDHDQDYPKLQPRQRVETVPHPLISPKFSCTNSPSRTKHLPDVWCHKSATVCDSSQCALNSRSISMHGWPKHIFRARIKVMTAPNHCVGLIT